MQYVAIHGMELERTPQELLGKQLRQARLDAGFTQKELARQLGRLTPYISGVECGVDTIDPMSIWQWLTACGVPAPMPDATTPLNTPYVEPVFIPPAGDVLRSARRNACLTQVELAAAMRCSQAYVYQVERGKCPVSRRMWGRWMRACGVSEANC